MNNVTKDELKNIATRIVELRELLDMTAEDMAALLNMPIGRYLEFEGGEHDFPFSFLYEVAKKLGADLTEILTGEAPTLATFSLIRSGEGLPVKRRTGMNYQHLAYLFKNRATTPLLVDAMYDTELENAPIELNFHAGQEFDFILEGQLRIKIGDHEFVMNPGDSVYYDSNCAHGMVAVGGQNCKFIAVLSKM